MVPAYSTACIANAVLLVAVLVIALSKSDLLGADVGRGDIRTNRDHGNIRRSRGREDKESPIKQLEKAPTSKYHIFVASKPDTGSTLLANMVLGLFDRADANQYFMHFDLQIVKPRKGANIDDTIVTKTHINDLDVVYTHFRDDYDRVFFIVPNRGHVHLEERYCGHPDYRHMVLCLDYDDFVFADESKMNDSISYVAKKIQDQFPYFANVELDEENSSKRLKEMAATLEAMKNLSFDASDQKFGVHGGHAGRNKGGTSK
mmetsp:Transcript_10777/g.22794  ORF Transcript_10777/g.22794 Transcript_10777/m.22794 type:complete len:260 (+) Transcript_10777:110-889(+)